MGCSDGVILLAQKGSYETMRLGYGTATTGITGTTGAAGTGYAHGAQHGDTIGSGIRYGS
jgi:hypothetical protein